jgi:hypothetical protein
MKKLVVLIVLLGGIFTGLPQGYVTFLNNVAFATPDPTGGNRLVWLDAIGGTKLTGTQYTAELYSGPDANSLQPLPLSLARFRPATTIQPGTWNFAAGSVTLPGVDSGQSTMLQVRVWENASGSVPYDEAVVKNASNVFRYTVPVVGDTTPFGSFMIGLQSFALVPEPSAVALSVLGIAGLLLVHRRKR